VCFIADHDKARQWSSGKKAINGGVMDEAQALTSLLYLLSMAATTPTQACPSILR